MWRDVSGTPNDPPQRNRSRFIYTDMTAHSVLDAIGNTPLVELCKLVPAGSARVFVKLEYTNPNSSMKDWKARAVIERAEADGRLNPGTLSHSHTRQSRHRNVNMNHQNHE
jgi:hypothetical protein